ncbi:WG repeat-containing protein [Clostridium ljungdahlii]|uniref:WG repeat-containing protein n=1 Tax=Clostridium ljungdahlii TaxID=1538 RepID=UPI0038683ED5
MDSLAAVKMNNKWGYIDCNGKTVIDYKYKQSWNFSDGFAPVKIKEKWGLLTIMIIWL